MNVIGAKIIGAAIVTLAGSILIAGSLLASSVNFITVVVGFGGFFLCVMGFSLWLGSDEQAKRAPAGDAGPRDHSPGPEPPH